MTEVEYLIQRDYYYGVSILHVGVTQYEGKIKQRPKRIIL